MGIRFMNFFFYYMSGTKPNFTGTGNTIKGKEINKWVHKPNHKPKPRQKKPTNHSQSQPNPLSLTQPLIQPKETSQAVSLTQSPTEAVPKTTINSDTVPMDHPDQAKHNPNNGKPVHALVDLDIRDKRLRVRNMNKSWGAEVICLQETKMEFISRREI